MRPRCHNGRAIKPSILLVPSPTTAHTYRFVHKHAPTKVFEDGSKWNKSRDDDDNANGTQTRYIFYAYLNTYS